MRVSGLSWFGVVTISSSSLFAASQAQPLPKRRAAAFEKSSLNFSKLPNLFS
jgi:hypothetical protein